MAAQEGVVIAKERFEKMQEALKQIEDITQSLTEFNPTYERIYNVARKGLGESQ